MNEKQTMVVEEMKPSVIHAEVPEGPCPLRNPDNILSQNEVKEVTEMPVPLKRNNGISNYEFKADEKKSKIPVSTFKQNIEKLKDKETLEPSQPPQPKLRTNIPTANSNDKAKNRNTVDDFDRLFGDLTQDGRSSMNSDILKELSPADPNQIDNYFEQIIKTYNKEQNAEPEEAEKGLDTPTTSVLQNFDNVLNNYSNRLREEIPEVKIAETVNLATNETRHQEKIHVSEISHTANIATNNVEPKEAQIAEVKIAETATIATNNIETKEEQIAETVKIATLDPNRFERVQIVDTFVPVHMEQVLIVSDEERNKTEPITIHPDNMVQPLEIINVVNDINTVEEIDLQPTLIDRVDIQPVAIHPDNILQPIEVINVVSDMNTVEEIDLQPTLIDRADIQPVAIHPDNIVQPIEVINVVNDVNMIEEIDLQPTLIDRIDIQPVAIHPDNIAQPIEIINVVDDIKTVEETNLQPSLTKPVAIHPDNIIEPIKIVNQDENENSKKDTQTRIPRRFNRNIKVYPMSDVEEKRTERKTLIYEDVARIRSVFKTIKSIESDNLIRDTEKISGRPEVIAVIKKKDAEKTDIKKFRSMSSIENLGLPKSRSRVELDLGTTIKGRVELMINRIKSIEKNKFEKEVKNPPKKLAVRNRVAIFEQGQPRECKMDEKLVEKESIADEAPGRSEEELQTLIGDLLNAKKNFGSVESMPTIKLSDGNEMPVLTIGTALLDPALTKYVIMSAIDLGYRAIDSAFIYGNEKAVGEGIRAKIEDGTVKREDLFILNKLWSTFHKEELVEQACRSSLETMGLEYFDLFLIHNPMSFKEGKEVIPKIANVIQFSTSDYMDAWRGMELLVKKQLVRSIGVSNFNSQQIARIHDKGSKKPVVNQVECHPYLNQLRLDEFCSIRDVKLSCFATLGSKGTPAEYKTSDVAVIDDPIVKVLAAGTGRTPAQVLIRYQLDHERNVVVKSSSPKHLWENLQTLSFKLTTEEIDTLNALNKNRRYFNFKGMGDTHKNYPFAIPF